MTWIGMPSVQTAFYTRLSGDAPFMALVNDVTDTVLDDVPYVYLGDNTEIPFNTFGRVGHEVTFTIHVYTRDEVGDRAGNKQGFEILEAATALLCATPLVVTGHATVMCNLEFADSIVDTDGVTRDTVARFRVIIQNNS